MYRISELSCQLLCSVLELHTYLPKTHLDDLMYIHCRFQTTINFLPVSSLNHKSKRKTASQPRGNFREPMTYYCNLSVSCKIIEPGLKHAWDWNAKASLAHSQVVYALNPTHHSFMSLQWSGLFDQWTFLLTENYLQAYVEMVPLQVFFKLFAQGVGKMRLYGLLGGQICICLHSMWQSRGVQGHAPLENYDFRPFLVESGTVSAKHKLLLLCH